jgi:hypothetical protein
MAAPCGYSERSTQENCCVFDFKLNINLNGFFRGSGDTRLTFAAQSQGADVFVALLDAKK